VATLLPFLCRTEDLLRWRAVAALGRVTARLAAQDLEAARSVVRRLRASLAEESGGIGWGAPEAMGEILANHRGLADEFAHLLASCLADVGVLDNDHLLRGALWGLGRLGETRPALLAECAPRLEPFLGAGDPALRGLAAWALLRMGGALPPERAAALLADEAAFSLWADGAPTTRRVRDVAARRAGRP
jgi:hypothetical protein